MRGTFAYAPATILLAAIIANHIVVWLGHDAIIVWSPPLGILMLLCTVGCIVVTVRAARRPKATRPVLPLVISVAALAVEILDIVIPVYPQRQRPNPAMEPTASRRTIHLYMSSTRQPAATRALARGG